jgi:hypothetical protein
LHVVQPKALSLVPITMKQVSEGFDEQFDRQFDRFY